MSRQSGGRETWNRLLYWDKGQTDSERLSSHILKSEGYESIDPSHPLGGQDGGKDIICKKEDLKIIGACFFPRGQQSFSNIKSKFISDLEGIFKNNADGIAFITNQELKLSDRKELLDLGGKYIVELYHLERVASILDSPANYGIRLDFLDIELTKEELLAFQAQRDKEYFEKIETLNHRINDVTSKLENYVDNLIGYSTGGDTYGFIAISPDIDDDDINSLLFITEGKYSMFNISITMLDLSIFKSYNTNDGIYNFHISEVLPNSSVNLKKVINLKGKAIQKYNIFYSSRNGYFTQLLRLYKINGIWRPITKVFGPTGKVVYQDSNSEIPNELISWE